MNKKRRVPGTPFKLVFDARRHCGRASVPSKDETIPYKRYDNKLFQQVLNNTQLPLHRLPGVRLRPFEQLPTRNYDNDVSSDVIDLSKLNQAHDEAFRQHKQYALTRKSTKHSTNLKLEKIRNQGFGVQALLYCTQCFFKSAPFKLYETTPTGACLTNVQAGVAFSKTSIKPSDASFLFSTLNINAPSRNALQTHFTNVNQAASQVLESALSQNRGIVRDYVSMQSEVVDPVPSVRVAFDGQYDKPLYHGYDGKSTSVSEPVLEAETGMNLLISHSVVSKSDGTYDKEKVRSPLVIWIVDGFPPSHPPTCSLTLSTVSISSHVLLAYQWRGTGCRKSCLQVLSSGNKPVALGSLCLGSRFRFVCCSPRGPWGVRRGAKKRLAVLLPPCSQGIPSPVDQNFEFKRRAYVVGVHSTRTIHQFSWSR